MPTDTRPVFVSYASGDSEFVKGLAVDLAAAGVVLWRDEININPGERWYDAVPRALTDCRCCLVILSPDSVASQYVKDEIAFALKVFALDKTKKIIPVLYKPCDIPFLLLGVRYIDFTLNYQLALQHLLNSLAAEIALARPLHRRTISTNAEQSSPKQVIAERIPERQPTTRRGSRKYQKDPNAKAVNEHVPDLSLNQFLSLVRKDSLLTERCDLLQHIRAAFEKHAHFDIMELGIRKAIAGLPSNFDPRWALFGSMKGAGYFHQAVNKNSPHISRALDRIPLDGKISHSAYEDYIKEFTKAFSQNAHGIATATRLLALKRPDQVVCLNSQNQRELCKNFGIAQTAMDFDLYWREIIEPIMATPWWNAVRPSNEDASIWDGRAALLDAVFWPGFAADNASAVAP